MFYLDYLWHDMQMSRAMNIKDGRVCRGAVFNELGDRWARALVPSVLRQGPGRVKDTCRPTRGPQGGAGARGGMAWAAPALNAHPGGPACPQPGVPGGDPASAPKGGEGCRLPAGSWLFKLLNYARGGPSSSLHYLNYKYR